MLAHQLFASAAGGVAGDLEGDAAAAGDDLDAADARVEVQRAAVGDVEAFADGVVRAERADRGEQTEGQDG